MTGRNDLTLRIAAPLLALVAALAISGVVLALTGNSPLEVLEVVFDDGFETKPLVETFNRAAPYYIAGVAVAIGFRMNLFNIGVEGQYRVAALVGAFAGAEISAGPFSIVIALVVAMLTGALWALVPAVLKVTRGVSEVISSIMLNSIALGFIAWLLANGFAAEGPGLTGAVGTEPMPASARLPLLNEPLEAIGLNFPPGARLQSYLFVALLVGILYRTLIWKTTFGFDLRATGSNPDAAQASGVNAKRMVMTAMLLSGATAGLIGMNNILSNVGTQARYTDLAVPAMLGFTGIAIALLGRNNPLGIAFAALLWAFLDALQTPLLSAGMPRQTTAILQGIILLSVVVSYEVVRRISVRREASNLRRQVDDTTAEPPPDGGDDSFAGAPA